MFSLRLHFATAFSMQGGQEPLFYQPEILDVRAVALDVVHKRVSRKDMIARELVFAVQVGVVPAEVDRTP